jgi:hypothetical protein
MYKYMHIKSVQSVVWRKKLVERKGDGHGGIQGALVLYVVMNRRLLE